MDERDREGELMSDELNRLLTDYSKGLLALFGDNLTGIYLTGSAALGGYHAGKSDIDFTVVMEQPLNCGQVSELKALHAQIKAKYPKSKLEGHYLTLAELGKEPDAIEPVVAYYGGKVARSYHGINAVTWFTLKKHGLTVWGRPAPELAFDASEADLLGYVIGNVNSYWSGWLARSQRTFSLRGLYALTAAAVEWGVAGISRMSFTLAERDVTSKDTALAYALQRTPAKYGRILREARRIRTGVGSKQYASPLRRRRDMLEYLKEIIGECNRLNGGMK